MAGSCTTVPWNDMDAAHGQYMNKRNLRSVRVTAVNGSSLIFQHIRNTCLRIRALLERAT